MMSSWKDWKRFFAKVHIPEDPRGCWGWTAAQVHGKKAFRDGDYGAFVSEFGHTAHRFSYSIFKGKIPKHLELDHLCRNRPCTNPDHLELVTRKENLRRGRSANREKTHCPGGHEFTPENTMFKLTAKGYIGRQCRTCRRAKTNEARARLRVEDPEKWKAQWRRWYEARKITGSAYKYRRAKDLQG